MKERDQAGKKRKYLTPRRLIANGLTGAVFAGAAVSGGWETPERFNDSGFAPIGQHEHNELIAGYKERELPFSPTDLPEKGMLYDGNFIVPDDDQPVFVKLVGELQPQPTLHAVRVQVDQEDDYILPLIQGPEMSEAMVQLGSLDEGSHKLTLYQDPDAPLSDDETSLQITTPEGDSLLARIYENSPRLAIRPDNKEQVKNDIPLMSFAQATKKGDEYLVLYTQVFSSEDGGIAPEKVLYQWGRYSDVEWTYKAILKEGGEREGAHFQSKDHTERKFRGQWEGAQPELQIVTKNNNFSDALKTDIFFSPRPLFLPPDISPDMMVRLWPSLQEISKQELLQEGRISQAEASQS